MRELTMVVVQEFDPAEERRLLRGWFETTSFAAEPDGLPPLEPEDDDEPDEE